MWVIKNNQQLFSFLVAIISGVCFCLLYDLFRAYRRVLKSKSISVIFQDVLFWTIVAVITFLLMLALCCGEIRAFICFGQLLGFVVCRITISRYFFTVVVFILKNFKHLISVLIKLKNKVEKKILTAFSKVCRILAKKVKNIGKYFKKPLETNG